MALVMPEAGTLAEALNHECFWCGHKILDPLQSCRFGPAPEGEEGVIAAPTLPIHHTCFDDAGHPERTRGGDRDRDPLDALLYAQMNEDEIRLFRLRRRFTERMQDRVNAQRVRFR